MQSTPTEKPKRFYKAVDIAETNGLWHVMLDGRTPKTPAKKSLAFPTQDLAQRVADEWDAQAEHIDLQAMTLTRLANVAIDRTPETRTELAAEVEKYAGTDLLCYLAEHPQELQDRQEAHFRPLRDWAGREHGVLLMTTQGVLNAPQPPASLEAARAFAERQNDYALTGLVFGLNLFGSAILAMAVADGELAAMDAYDISRIDEEWQIERWGEDDEAMARVEAQRREVSALDSWFKGLASAAVV
ncbi:ATP12 family chaperone protein [Ponticaulis profundi]|uniref:ATP12 family chaperone protein n=1 Tax=Ponticaulis profundi TaxID=2665222 RepID=A0ABW1SFD1_9PROT